MHAEPEVGIAHRPREHLGHLDAATVHELNKGVLRVECDGDSVFL